MTFSTDIGFAGPDDIDFTFAGSDEGTEVNGSGFGAIGADESFEIELSFRRGDVVVPKARRRNRASTAAP